MPKCPSCPQFTSKDTDTEPEVNIEVDAAGVVTGDARIHNDCSECGEELEETTFSVEEDFTDDVKDHETPDGKPCEDIELEVTESTSRSDRTQTHDRNGRKIRSSRYARRYYGVDVEITVTCQCGQSWTHTWADEVTAGSMDSLV